MAQQVVEQADSVPDREENKNNKKNKIKLKDVPQRYKDIIFGYLRTLTNIDMNKLSNDIIHIIVLYYYIHLEFYTKSTYI